MSLKWLSLQNSPKKGSQDIPQVFPKEKEQRQHRAQLNDHMERKYFVIRGNAKHGLPNEQMRCGRNRDKFGQTLDNAKDEGMKKSHYSPMLFDDLPSV